MIDRGMILNMAGGSGDINEYLMSLYNIPVQMNAKTIVEIGSGVSTFALLAAAQKTGGHLTSIDIGGWDTINRVPNGAETLKDETNFTMITGNSLEVSWANKGMIDLLFWDSEHTLELSRKEIEAWFGYVRKGGIIMAHDMMHESPDKQGARIALDEFLKENENYHAIFLNDTKLIGMGIILKL